MRVERITPLSIDRSAFGLPPDGASLPVVCECMDDGCICQRVDPELDYRTSSLLVCQRCCEGHHVYARHKHEYRCECGKVLP